MDPLKADSVRGHHETTARERLLQALEVMREGFELKRANLRRQHPEETEEQIDVRLAAWMADG